VLSFSSWRRLWGIRVHLVKVHRRLSVSNIFVDLFLFFYFPSGERPRFPVCSSSRSVVHLEGLLFMPVEVTNKINGREREQQAWVDRKG
jgi:hypothetical protein